MKAATAGITPLLVALLVWAPPAAPQPPGFNWPLRPPPAVIRGFDAPNPNWHPGHRGVDLVGFPGQPVLAPDNGTVAFAGVLADRALISITHPGGLRTSYEPVLPIVRPGQRVVAGAVIGELAAGHPGCPMRACLHWGAMWGRAADANYVNPLGLLTGTPIRLKLLHG